MKKRVKMNITISPKTKRRFLSHCRRHEYVPSRRIEQLMIKDLNENFISEGFKE